MSPLFTWIIFASVGIEIALGVLLLVGRAQYDRKYPAYRTARRLYALMFFQFALQTLVLNTVDFPSYKVRVAVLVVAFTIVTIFLSTALITFVDPKYFTRSLLVKKYFALFFLIMLAVIVAFVDDSVSAGVIALAVAILMFVSEAALMTISFLKRYMNLLRITRNSNRARERKTLTLLFASGLAVILMGPGAFLTPFIPTYANIAYFTALIFGVLFCYFAYDAFSRNMGSIYVLAVSGVLADEETEPYYQLVEEPVKKAEPRTTRTSFKEVCHQLDTWNEKKGYLEAGITTDILAERFSTSRKYISRYFNEVAHMTFRDYVNTLRIEEAKRLMRTTSLDDNDISKVIGFTSRAQFVGLFKTIAGVTPSVWRKADATGKK